jgi:UDP-N-acetylmuramoyl-tripeptide--D-alanyl-D-alanine ligase
MKIFFKFWLKHYLGFMTRLTLLIHRPTVIAIAGSINKPFAKQAIKGELEKQGLNVRANPKNFNTEIGLPLAVLNLPSGYNCYHNWLPTLWKAPLRVFNRNFPEFLVVSLGTSDPGDMKYLAKLVKPRIAVITDITQRYLEGFSDMDELVNEYQELIQKIPRHGLVVMNGDNERLRAAAKKSRAQVIFYGFKNDAKWQATGVKKTKQGQTFKIIHNNNSTQHAIRSFGRHHIYACLAGIIINNYVQKKGGKTKTL